MAIEVEQKFRVADRQALEQRLAALGAKMLETVEQVDRYYAHPSRDFAQTDEALRLRRVGHDNYMTYKGPKLDDTTKTRREIEIPLAADEAVADDAGKLLQALGFGPVAEVRKFRTPWTLDWQGQSVGISFDQIRELGDFIELEIVTSKRDMATARDAIGSLATHLGLTRGERLSYLELLMRSRNV
jgi:adenylate cyclase, class 2